MWLELWGKISSTINIKKKIKAIEERNKLYTKKKKI